MTREHRATSLTLALSVVTLAGCGPYRATTDPDAMSEAAHRERAESLRVRAARQQRSYDPSRIRRSDTTHGGYEGIAGSSSPDSTHPSPPGQVIDPGLGRRREARRLRELAREHEDAADALMAFEASECAAVPASERAACPLLGAVRAVRAIEHGVELELVDGADADAVVRHTRCHTAFGRRRGREGMSSCPLYVDGVRVSVVDGTLILTTQTSSQVDELRRLAGEHAAAE